MRLTYRAIVTSFIMIMGVVLANSLVEAAPVPNTIVIPLVLNVGPQWIYPQETFETLPVESAPTDRPAEDHADLNLSLRSYEETQAYIGLVNYNGGVDGNAPDLRGLLAGFAIPSFTSIYRVYDWNWDTNSCGELITYPDVTLLGLAVDPGAAVFVPPSGYSISGDYGFEVLVLYASESRITLKYTGEDNVVSGYTLHIENVAVHPDLLALYEACNAEGRETLPALREGQCFGVANGDELGIAIRDSGTFMDPRSLKDWWQ